MSACSAMAGRRRWIALITRGRLGAPRIATLGRRRSEIHDGTEEGVALATTWDEETGFTSTSLAKVTRLDLAIMFNQVNHRLPDAGLFLAAGHAVHLAHTWHLKTHE